MGFAAKVGKKCAFKLARMALFSVATPLTGGLGAIPLMAEIFDVADVALEVGTTLLDVSGAAKAANVIDKVANLGEEMDDLGNVIDESMDDGELNFDDVQTIVDEGLDVIRSYEDLDKEISSDWRNKKGRCDSNGVCSSDVVDPVAVATSVAGRVAETTMVDATSAGSMVFSALRQAQVLSAVGMGINVVGHGVSWYGLHTLNQRLDQMALEADVHLDTVQRELETSLHNLAEDIRSGFRDIYEKLDHMNEKINRLNGVRKLKKLMTNAADAETGNDFLGSVTRGDIVECQENLLEFAYEYLDGASKKTDRQSREKQLREGLLQASYAVSAYELEFAWLLAKRSERSTKMLPERLEEGARRLGLLLGRYLSETKEWDNSNAESFSLLFQEAVSLSNQYVKVFAPPDQKAGQKTLPNLTSSPQTSCAEAFLAIGEASLLGGDREGARRAYQIALAFDPFLDATWICLHGRLSIDIIAKPSETEVQGVVSLALDTVKRHGIHQEMSQHRPRESQQYDKGNTFLYAILLFVEACKVCARSPANAACQEGSELDEFFRIATILSVSSELDEEGLVAIHDAGLGLLELESMKNGMVWDIDGSGFTPDAVTIAKKVLMQSFGHEQKSRVCRILDAAAHQTLKRRASIVQLFRTELGVSCEAFQCMGIEESECCSLLAKEELHTKGGTSKKNEERRDDGDASNKNWNIKNIAGLPLFIKNIPGLPLFMACLTLALTLIMTNKKRKYYRKSTTRYTRYGKPRW